MRRRSARSKSSGRGDTISTNSSVSCASGCAGRSLTLFPFQAGSPRCSIVSAIAFRRTARIGLYAAFVISIVYAAIGTVLVPWLWFDPLGPMLKIGPIMVFNLVALAIYEDR